MTEDIKAKYKKLASLLNELQVAVAWDSEYICFADDDSDYYVSTDDQDIWRLYKPEQEEE
jgi:hypothetical protein